MWCIKFTLLSMALKQPRLCQLGFQNIHMKNMGIIFRWFTVCILIVFSGYAISSAFSTQHDPGAADAIIPTQHSPINHHISILEYEAGNHGSKISLEHFPYLLQWRHVSVNASLITDDSTVCSVAIPIWVSRHLIIEAGLWGMYFVRIEYSTVT